ncbi:uncharacterized protein LOC119657785 [Hermetia illucens]|uniref:uncharacterized protein LOC119657785 n=1 Tax=Hermetia illucens TaxID=343691 RepID=UPI0018CC1333|nr:uncharacterized protein LOC119657785 [Hermetia illucens]XP_037920788.1 uncharacterized protein LOC119657785 [Hermetia illucens]XP_037920789.1 uncharacterized protein LOC119657785 [Hermetia illucens]XP_037920790.1 uncharacterized protein LOC119657785 [Hermetia illucens]XP_037920792.1 uncharacterized protein LOC119657785 [Hermetia illucens]XP_037920793.1 uncharacterized protein LOC119657785 [Hermetia illucens]XP_037920794.1 uncharacterized protein LOC119657785 [Hermetia illucens]XP_03792079
MSNSMYYKETFLIAITLIATTALADDYHSNEEVTSTSSLDFFDVENTNEFYDPSKQLLLPDTLIRDHVMADSVELAASQFLGSQSPPASDSFISKNMLTTLVPPSFDASKQTISTFDTQRPVADDEDIFNYTTTSSTMNEIAASDHFLFTNVSAESEFIEDQDTILTTTPRTKQGKQITISNLKPHEALRKFVQDSYIRRPLAILIDTAHDSLERIKELWMDALQLKVPLDCVLLAYDASGVTVTYNFTNTWMLIAGIESIKSSQNTPGKTFFGIIRAIELIPYDSAVFVSTGLLPADENLAQYAAMALLKKRIRLYLSWMGDKPLTENETHQEGGGTLGSVAVRSGGEVIFAEETRNGEYPADNMDIVFDEHTQGLQDQELTITPTVSDIYIKVGTALNTATLETPNGG